MPIPYINVNRPGDVPEGKHWVILEFGSINIPGDERSRTNPGHGYGPSTQTTRSYKAYLSHTDWVAAIERLEKEARKGTRSYVALIVDRPRITTKVMVSVT